MREEANTVFIYSLILTLQGVIILNRMVKEGSTEKKVRQSNKSKCRKVPDKGKAIDKGLRQEFVWYF